MRISVVIPTYNRNDDLSRVLDHILASTVDGFSKVEVIVVDDGSPTSAELVVKSKQSSPPFDLKYVRQENAGPAEARNHGYRLAANEIVLFIDDDVLVLPDLLRKHVEAHGLLKNSVVVGPYPYLEPENPNSEYRYLSGLINESYAELTGGLRSDFPYVKVQAVASGNLSVNKSTFGNRVYRDGLEIPAGEEFELNARLKSLNIPIYFAPEIRAWHLQPTTIEGACVQNYKYGLGVAEVAIKEPTVLELPEFSKLLATHDILKKSDSFRMKAVKIVRLPVALPYVRKLLVKLVRNRLAEVLGDRALFRIYRFVIGTFLFAGVRDGINRFKSYSSEPEC